MNSTGGRKGTRNLGGFQAEQSHIRVYEELCKECRRSSRIDEVLKKEFALSVKRIQGLAKVLKIEKSSIVEGDRWKKIERFGRFSKRK